MTTIRRMLELAGGPDRDRLAEHVTAGGGVSPNPDEDGPLPEGAAGSLGNYSIAGFEFDFARSIFNFDPIDQPDTDNGFFGTLETDLPEDPDIIPRLAIPDSGRVRVRLGPLTPDRRGRPRDVRSSTEMAAPAASTTRLPPAGERGRPPS